jgi:small-conductance mechanosensitive channel
MRALCLAAVACSMLVGQDASAPVVIDGKEILRVYGPLGPFSTRERAIEIEHRVTLLAEKRVSDPIRTRLIQSEGTMAIVSGSVLLMGVTDADAEKTGIPREQLAARDAAAIQQAIDGYRVRHTWRSFLKAVGLALLIWTVFGVVVWIVRKAVRWLDRRVTGWVTRQVSTSGARGSRLIIWERGRMLAMLLLKGVVFLSVLSASSFVISYTFSLFPQTAGISTTLLDYLRDTFGSAAMAVVRYLPDGGFVVIVCVIAYYLLKVLKFLAQAIEGSEIAVKAIQPEMAKPTYQIVRFAVVVFALVVAFPYLPGGNSEAFRGVSIFLGVLLSLGSSSAVSNILAGLVLTYMRAFHVGDRVRIAETTGDVLQRSLLVTRVRTIKNVEVVIPNGAILSSQVLNFSSMARSQGLILNTSVTIGYNAPWRTVHEVLIRAALNTEGILPKPAPFVLQTSLNDYHVSYEVNAYTDEPNNVQNIYSRLHQAIQDSFNDAGIEIMSPTYQSLRDGNPVTIPENYLPPDYQAPGFRVKDVTASPEDSAAKRGASTAGD